MSFRRVWRRGRELDQGVPVAARSSGGESLPQHRLFGQDRLRIFSRKDSRAAGFGDCLIEVSRVFIEAGQADVVYREVRVHCDGFVELGQGRVVSPGVGISASKEGLDGE